MANKNNVLRTIIAPIGMIIATIGLLLSYLSDTTTRSLIILVVVSVITLFVCTLFVISCIQQKDKLQ